MPPAVSGFARALIAWQRHHGRHDLPWQGTRDAYRIWLSEIMLQQTQVGAVLPYYRRFLDRFPDVHALAAARLDTVLELWSGLGYYARARNLHRAAGIVAREHGGRFPADAAALEALPGVGRSTAAAIAVFAHGARAAILDGNVKRVLARAFAVEGWPGAPAVERRLWEVAAALLPARGIEAYTQGLMDLGATLCTRAAPRCADCPLAARCLAHAQGRTAELPGARPRTRLPVRRATWIVWRRVDGRVGLVRRPPEGLWGGLWTFPETALGDRGGVPLQAIEHGFTHFRLRARVVARAAPAALARRRGWRWLAPADAARTAVPTPVRAVLLRLAAAPLSPARAPGRKRSPRAASRGGRGRRRTRAAAA